MSSRAVNMRRITAGIQLVRSRGLSTVEYVIILVLVAAVSVATWTAFGKKIKGSLGSGTTKIDSCLQGDCAGTPGGSDETTGNTPSPGVATPTPPVVVGGTPPAEPAAPQPKRKIRE